MSEAIARVEPAGRQDGCPHVRHRRIEGAQHYWEDLEVGDVLVGPGITVTEGHLVSWAGLTGDIVQFHVDAEYAAATPFGQRVAHGPLTLSFGLGLMTHTGYLGNVVAWLGLDEVRALKPVFIGDTVHPEARMLEARPSKDASRGVWRLAYTVKNQGGDAVMSFVSGFLVARRRDL